MQKLKMHSLDLTEQNIAKLAELFPNVVTESFDAAGKVVRAIDFDALRQELADHVVEGQQERYQLDWPGKRAATLAANAPVAKTLRPVREESVDFDTTQNLFIEGDNLDALKLLQESYLGKVRLIYIDPPYNTGNDFIYTDDFAETKGAYFERSGMVDGEGARLRPNPESDGRFHSNWLSMMFPRLRLARRLLTQEGVLLVSINDMEAPSVRRMLDEIFGESNFLCQFVWVNDGNVDQQSKIKGVHEYVLAYSRSAPDVARPTVIDPNVGVESKLFREAIENSITKNGPANPESTVVLPAGFPAPFEDSVIRARSDPYPILLDELQIERGALAAEARLRSGWSSRTLLDRFIATEFEPVLDAEGRETWFELRPSGAIYMLKRRATDQGHVLSVLRNMGTTKKNSSRLADWGIRFSYPKPVTMIDYLVSVFAPASGSSIVMDFFSGSATTAHAVMLVNARDGGNRRHIQIQIGKDPAADSAAEGLAAMARRRIRKAGSSLPEAVHRNWNQDVGFRVLKIDSTNRADVRRTPDEQSQEELFEFLDSIKPDRTGEDVLFQVMLDWGLELSLPIGSEQLHGHEVFTIDGGALIGCFSRTLTLDVVRTIAERQPVRAVFLASGFASDADRINAGQLFRELAPDGELKAI